ncbi:MAG TPA: acyl-CoA dehydrogenase family protein [Myxococcales bacterium]|nr:acyl-CoA dehydrogenase family protein [Myxococcales bacterium]HET9753915.1 acyl-CoA dehydrogenase family protein [Myxococcales bacterium]
MENDTLDLEQLIGWDTLLADEERQVRASVRRIVKDRFMPRIVGDYEEGRFPLELVPELAKLGLLGANLEGYGCAGMGALAYGLACHELEACDSGLRSFVSVQTSLAMYAIHRYGSEQQKERWLPEMAAGRAIGCFGLTEPNHGSDPGSMETHADRDGNDWVLSGRKLWITNAQIAHVAVVWARTREGVRGFLLERGQPGYAAEDIPWKLSMRASFTGGLVLDGARVPESSRLPGASGLKAPLSCLDNARFGVAWGVLGAARACLEIALRYTRERTQFGVPLAAKQLVQLELADVASEIVKASLLSVHYSRLKEAGKLHPAQTSLLKRNNCRIALEAARRCRAVLGANGIAGDFHVMRHAANLESTYTYEGTDQIHTLAIGRALTGSAAF